MATQLQAKHHHHHHHSVVLPPIDDSAFLASKPSICLSTSSPSSLSDSFKGQVNSTLSSPYHGEASVNFNDSFVFAEGNGQSHNISSPNDNFPPSSHGTNEVAGEPQPPSETVTCSVPAFLSDFNTDSKPAESTSLPTFSSSSVSAPSSLCCSPASSPSPVAKFVGGAFGSNSVPNPPPPNSSAPSAVTSVTHVDSQAQTAGAVLHLRNILPEPPSGSWKTELCRTFQLRGVCGYAEKCQFAHGIQELRPRDFGTMKYKTQPCTSWHRDHTCRFGSRCRFVHDEQRIQINSSVSWLVSPSENMVRVELQVGHSSDSTSFSSSPSCNDSKGADSSSSSNDNINANANNSGNNNSNAEVPAPPESENTVNQLRCKAEVQTQVQDQSQRPSAAVTVMSLPVSSFPSRALPQFLSSVACQINSRSSSSSSCSSSSSLSAARPELLCPRVPTPLPPRKDLAFSASSSLSSAVRIAAAPVRSLTIHPRPPPLSVSASSVSIPCVYPSAPSVVPPPLFAAAPPSELMTPLVPHPAIFSSTLPKLQPQIPQHQQLSLAQQISTIPFFYVTPFASASFLPTAPPSFFSPAGQTPIFSFMPSFPP